jgi:GR25 family glycosyltransferase involved in LPS biosynthesis
MGIWYSCNWADRIRNYLLIHDELGLDPEPVIRHFEEFLGKDTAQAMIRTVQAELTSPFHFFDAIYCIDLDRQEHRWEAMQRRLRKLGIERKVRRFSAAETPLNHHIGCALSHRRIVAEAKQQQLKTVLVFEDDARFSPDAAEVLALSLRELEGLAWQLLYLGRV